MIYLFNRIGRRDLTQHYVSRVLNELYDTTPAGLCGNEDCGQMSAWFVMSAMGFYPVNPVGGEYELGTPLFREMALKLPDGKQFRVSAPGLSKKNIYVQEVTVDGRPYDKTYITHEQIMSGAHVVMKMTDRPCK